MNTMRQAVLTLLATLTLAIISSSPSEASFVDNGDGTVTQIMADSSRLMWLKDANLAATTGYPAYGSDAGGVGMSFDDCIAWVASLNAGGGFAGYTDWRMPTALNPDGSGPFSGFFSSGGTGEMIFLSFNEGVWFNAPDPPGTGPFINMQSSYWTGTSGIDVDDGFWNSVTGSLSEYPAVQAESRGARYVGAETVLRMGGARYGAAGTSSHAGPLADFSRRVCGFVDGGLRRSSVRAFKARLAGGLTDCLCEGIASSLRSSQ